MSALARVRTAFTTISSSRHVTCFDLPDPTFGLDPRFLGLPTAESCGVPLSAACRLHGGKGEQVSACYHNVTLAGWDTILRLTAPSPTCGPRCNAPRRGLDWRCWRHRLCFLTQSRLWWEFEITRASDQTLVSTNPLSPCESVLVAERSSCRSTWNAPADDDSLVVALFQTDYTKDQNYYEAILGVVNASLAFVPPQCPVGRRQLCDAKVSVVEDRTVCRTLPVSVHVRSDEPGSTPGTAPSSSGGRSQRIFMSRLRAHGNAPRGCVFRS